MMSGMSVRRWLWMRKATLVPALALLLGACGPAYPVRRAVDRGVDADDGQGGQSGEGGEGGQGGGGQGGGGTGGSLPIDAMAGGTGGQGGSTPPPDAAAPDSRPDLAVDQAV